MRCAGGPVGMVAYKIFVIPGVQRGSEKHAHDLDVPHLHEAAVGGERFSTNDAEFSTGYLFAQQIVFGVEGQLVKTSQLLKTFAVEEHEHSRAERFQQARELLHNVVAEIESLVHAPAVAAPNLFAKPMP